MSNAPSLISASRRTAPSLAEVAAEQRIIDGADPAQETPVATMAAPAPTAITTAGIIEPADLLDRLAARKPAKVQLTGLHVNIPVDLDNALAKVMKEKGIEKTAIVVAALRPILEAYL